MKAIAFFSFGGPEVLQLVDLPKPERQAGEALIRVEASGVGQGDCRLRQGELRAHFELALPVDPGPHGLVVGDRVAFLTPHFVPGSCAEFVARPAAGLVRVPDALDPATALAVSQPGCCAWISVATADLKAGERILVHGAAGTIGSLVVQLARQRGAHVIATCRSTSRDLVTALGAHEVRCFDSEDVFAGARDIDVVFDPLGGEVHRRSYDVLKPGGRLVYLVADPFEDRSATFGVRTVRAKIEDNAEILGAVLKLAADDTLRPLPPRTMPFERCADAHRQLEAGRQSPGRVVLTMA